MKKIFFEKQNVIKNIKKSGTPLVLFAPLWAFYQIEGPQMNSSHKLKGEKMQKIFFEKQPVTKNFKCLGEIFLSRGFLPCVRQTKKIEKSEYDFSIFSLVLYVGTF